MDDERLGIKQNKKKWKTATQNFIRLGRGGTVVDARKSAKEKSAKEEVCEEIIQGEGTRRSVTRRYSEQERHARNEGK